MTITTGGRSLAAGLAAALIFPAAANAVDLVPHRAVYAMTLESARPGSGIAGAHGRMVYKFSDSCDGWTVENRTELVIAHLDRPRSATAWEYVAWESKQGDRYRFWVSTARGGDVVEEIEGTAEMGPQGGVAHFTSPRELTVDLPEETLFPTEHTLRLLEAAQAGERLLLGALFDGTEVDGASTVNAVIGDRRPAGRAGVAADLDANAATLLAEPSWHVSLAFFPREEEAVQPDYEVALRYFANGVGTDIRQDFGDFTLRGTLETLEPLPRPEC